MSRRVPASQQTSERIGQLMDALEAHREGPSLTQLGLRKIVEELLESEVSERLGTATTSAATAHDEREQKDDGTP